MFLVDSAQKNLSRERTTFTVLKNNSKFAAFSQMAGIATFM